jgi:flagellar FliL protein
MATQTPKSEASAGDAQAAKPRRFVIVALAAAVAVAASGGYAWYQTMQGGHAPEVKPIPAPVFVVFEPVTVNLQSDAQEAQYLQVALTARVSETTDADMMKEYMPQLRSRLLMLLSSQRAGDIATADGKKKLVQDILAKMREPYSEHGPTQRVTNIYFTSFVIQ